MTKFVLMTEDQKVELRDAIEADGLYAVVTQDPISKWDPPKDAIVEHAKELVRGGVHTFEVTCRIPNWQEIAGYVLDAAKEVKGLIAAVGTHANILTIHEAVQMGIRVNVAPHGLKPLAGMYAVIPEQQAAAQEFEHYIRSHSDHFKEHMGMYDRDLLENAITMDPVAYCRARGAIVIPSFNTPIELNDLLSRGAFDGQKAFPFFGRSDWKDMVKAIPAVYRPYIRICATGGIDDTNLAEVFKTDGVKTAGASKLIGDTPTETYNRAVQYREIVQSVRQAS